MIMIMIRNQTCFFSNVEGLLGGGDIEMINKIFLICFCSRVRLCFIVINTKSLKDILLQWETVQMRMKKAKTKKRRMKV